MEENKIVIYQTEDGQTQIDVRLENDTVWLTQAQMAELFETDRTSIVRHINNIYRIDELERESTCAKIAQVQTEGKREVKRTIPYFNLDMIISVGYRVNSKRGIKFRQWANRILKQYLVKGYAINERIRKEQIGELRQLVQVVESTTPTGERRYIEVKSVSKSDRSFSLTNNEYTAAHQYGDAYYICLLHHGDEKSKAIYIQNPLAKLHLEKRIRQWEWYCEEYQGEEIEIEY